LRRTFDQSLSSLSDEPPEPELDELFEPELDEPFELELEELFELELDELFELELDELFELELDELLEFESDDLFEPESDELLEFELDELSESDEPPLPPDHQLASSSASSSATRMKSSRCFAVSALAVDPVRWLAAASTWSRCRAWAAPAVPSSRPTAAVVSQVILFMGADSLLLKLASGAPQFASNLGRFGAPPDAENRSRGT
jgi:hypothetical protein